MRGRHKDLEDWQRFLRAASHILRSIRLGPSAVETDWRAVAAAWRTHPLTPS